MTLRAQIAADASAVFLVTADFGVSIEHRRGETIETITAVVELDEPVVDEAGRNLSLARHGKLDCLKTVEVRTVQAGAKQPSLFTIDGETWAAESVLSEPDDAIQTVMIRRTDNLSTRRR